MGGIFGGSSGATNSAQTTRASGLRIQTSVYGTAIALCYGRVRVEPNLIWYGDFRAVAHEQEGGKGGGETGGGGSYTYGASVQLSLCEGPIEAVLSVWESKGRRAIGSTRFTTFLGTYPQTPWSHLTTNHPTEALPYPGIAHCDCPNYKLGSSDALPNFNFEVDGLCQNVSGSYDCDPAEIIMDLLTDPRHGAGFPSARFAFPSVYSGYCRAAGLLIAPVYREQTEASELLSTILEMTHSECYCSEGQLLIASYGDENLSGHGGTYTAPTTVADLGVLDEYGEQHDFLSRGDGEDLIKITRKRPADAYNEIKLEYYNRLNDYNAEPATVSDQQAIERYGYRPEDQVDGHIFCDGTAAHMAAGLRLNRQKVLNSYEFVLGFKWIKLDPMDLITITDSSLGLDQQWVRIKEITEDDNGELTIVAEEYIQGIGTARVYPYEIPQGYVPNRHNDPGNVSSPLIFEPPAELSESRELWCAVAGGPDWGGCDVYASTDGNSFKKLGKIEGAARYGTVRSAFASGTDPDTTHTLQVDMGISRAELSGGTRADADQENTLCYVDGEFISYQSCAIVSNYQYNLGTYIRRGLHGSIPGSHVAGSWFARIDENLAKIPYPKKIIGNTIWLKFVSFNLFGKEKQDLASVYAYQFTVGGGSNPWHPVGTDDIDPNAVTERYSLSAASYDIVSTVFPVAIVADVGPVLFSDGETVRITGKIGDCEGKVVIRILERESGGSVWSVKDQTTVASTDNGGSVAYQFDYGSEKAMYFRLDATSPTLANNLLSNIGFSVIAYRR
jgi:hypothetical protein